MPRRNIGHAVISGAIVSFVKPKWRDHVFPSNGTRMIAMKLLTGFMGVAAIVAFSGPALAQGLVLAEGTPIHLQTREDLSSKDARKGDKVELTVAEPVIVNGVTVIPVGAPATGEISRARDNGLLGRSGKLEIEVRQLSADGRIIPLRGQENAKGKGGTIGAVGAGIVFLPLAIVVKGKEAKIPAGSKVDMYVDQPVQLTDTGLQSDLAPPPAPPVG
jgi:hypothetical protein